MENVSNCVRTGEQSRGSDSLLSMADSFRVGRSERRTLRESAIGGGRG